MLAPVKCGADLIREIDLTLTATPTLWWLGHSGFIVRFANITFYIDPCFSDLPGRPRLCAAPLSGDLVRHADMVLATHAHPGHLDAPSVVQILAASPRSKLVVPRSAGDAARDRGIPYERTTPTDSALRIEYFKDNLYGRIYAIPSAHPQLDWTAGRGYPYLGYLIRFGRWTIYHAGDCAMYSDLAARLRPFNVSIALLPVGGKNFSVTEAAQLAEDIGAAWAIPMHYGTFEEDRESAFVAHMLGHRPEQRFRVFRVGEKWTVPEQ
ncbi:MAG: MBL fold metallo-hydrolase [Bryobacterales bacterium]|nr:MBL fold metallo-hydrolase [Bryobacterales bacterium]MBV9398082.1 MBL fold metallo-hydrolase [Bryobacterales bacterium]